MHWLCFPWLLSIAAFIPAHWHIWRTLPAFAVLSSAQLSKSGLLLMIKVLPERGKRELKEEKDRERDKESERVLQTTEQMQTHISWHVTIIMSEASSSFKRIVSPKKMKILSSFTRFKHLWLFTSMENKSTPSQRPVKLQQGQKAP